MFPSSFYCSCPSLQSRAEQLAALLLSFFRLSNISFWCQQLSGLTNHPSTTTDHTSIPVPPARTGAGCLSWWLPGDFSKANGTEISPPLFGWNWLICNNTRRQRGRQTETLIKTNCLKFLPTLHGTAPFKKQIKITILVNIYVLAILRSKGWILVFISFKMWHYNYFYFPSNFTLVRHLFF